MWKNAKNEVLSALLKGEELGCGDIDISAYGGLTVKYRGKITLYYVYNLSDGGLEETDIFENVPENANAYFLLCDEFSTLEQFESLLDEAKEYFDDNDLYDCFGIDIFDISIFDVMTMLYEYLTEYVDHQIVLCQPESVDNWLEGGKLDIIDETSNIRI